MSQLSEVCTGPAPLRGQHCMFLHVMPDYTVEGIRERQSWAYQDTNGCGNASVPAGTL